MKINRLKCIAMGLLSLMVSCGQQGSERQLKENVDSFATHYFNWQFEQAIPYCTPTSKVWLQFAASNVHSEDIDVLRNRDEGASIELGEIHDTDNDSIAYIDLIVRNYVRMDTIGKPAQVIEEDQYSIPLLYQNEQWKVDLKGMPRWKKH
ncbi:MAG: hypothetical protein LKE41_00530 [Prevotella sp.]|jgi:hypothetical protein|nr:hypothetical protein [Prevotella sp.]MCI2080712.1 hypothetical protein [Prevotella sp.]MCI2102622.1 hypothetical protein [Prevotella sp.]